MYIFFVSLSVSAFVFCIAIIVYRLLSRSRELTEKRLEKLTNKKNEAAAVKKRGKKGIGLLSKLPSALGSGKWYSDLASELVFAGVALRPEEYIMAWILASFGSAAIAYSLGARLLVIAGIFLIGALIPPVMLKRMKAKTLALFDKQLVDAMTIMGNCLKAGFTFQQAMESISKEMPNPVAREFGRAIREIRLGMPMEDSLNRLVKRTGSEDLDLLVHAILIQRQVGGNLSEILDNISMTIKERLRIKGEIKVLTATGRISGYIIGLLPVFLMLILMVVNPKYMETFFVTKEGGLMLACAAVLETIGFLIVKKVVDIKY